MCWWWIAEDLIEDAVEKELQQFKGSRTIGRRALQHFKAGEVAADEGMGETIHHHSKAICKGSWCSEPISLAV